MMILYISSGVQEIELSHGSGPTVSGKATNPDPANQHTPRPPARASSAKPPSNELTRGDMPGPSISDCF
jgi:hypothetical protein